MNKHFPILFGHLEPFYSLLCLILCYLLTADVMLPIGTYFVHLIKTDFVSADACHFLAFLLVLINAEQPDADFKDRQFLEKVI